METFPDDHVVHNLPLIFLSGLEDPSYDGQSLIATSRSVLNEGGFRVKVDLPVIDSPLAKLFLSVFHGYDGSEAAWSAQASSPSQKKLFKIKTIGRVFSLPPRKAPPPPHSPRLTARDRAEGAPAPLVLHSPLSPLTPSSPLYSDGIITPLWIAKHQYSLPSALFVFFTLTADFNTSSLLDNKIKTAINNIRSLLLSTNYKTRLVVILLADGPIEASDVEERLGVMRKAISLDPKSLLFCPHNASQMDVEEFTHSLLSSLRPNCIEYYRDLSKHARRKRSRGTTPQPTVAPTISHVLPSQGWNARYEFKLGVFAEFRQEMDAACRNYEAAYESVFSSEVIESIAIGETRFNEARLSADVIAIRIVRCLLWNAQTTNAVKAWASHRDRVQDLLDRRGRGTENYGWEAWQSLWSKTMSQLITRADLPALNIKSPGLSEIVSIFAGPDKSLAVGERLMPWEQLVHEGYWLDMAQSYTDARRWRASELPVETRMRPTVPNQNDVGKVHNQDLYFTQAPYEEMPADGTGGFDYTRSIASDLDAAIKHFDSHGQLRMREILLLKKGLEYFQTGAWDEVITTLRPMWNDQVWRRSGWWKLLQHIGWTLFECAHRTLDARLLVVLSWELGNSNFDTRPSITYDLNHALDGCVPPEEVPSIALSGGKCAMRMSPSFAFAKGEGHVGEPVECQFVLFSCSHPGSAPIRLSEVKIAFDGVLKPVYISNVQHNDEKLAEDVETVNLVLQESSRLSESAHKRTSAGGIASLLSEGNLVLHPGQTRIFNFRLTPREAGEVSLASTTLIIDEEKFSLVITNPGTETNVNQWFETKVGHPSMRRIGPERNVCLLQILAKPPKVEVSALNFIKTYYTNEVISLDLEIENNEEDESTVSVEARLISPIKGAVSIRWLDDSSLHSQDEDQDMVQTLPVKDLGTLQSSGKSTVSLLVTDTIAAVDHELEVTVSYQLKSDEETVLRKVLALDLAVIRPFEANYEFSPRLLKETWPNFFSMSPDAASSTSPQGLQHLYRVTANIFSFATDPVVVEAIILTTTTITGSATASSTTGVFRDENALQGSSPDQISGQIDPEQTRSFDFELAVQKHVLGDRHAVTLGLSLEIGWRRIGSEKVNTTVLEVPPFQILIAEPRVLLTVNKKSSTGSGINAYCLTYTIENPSMHFLTFNITMESSEDFAFSGSKALTTSLVPISRHVLQYTILPNKTNQSVKVQLSVVDAYFNQTLKVQPADDTVKLDKKGSVLVWVD